MIVDSPERWRFIDGSDGAWHSAIWITACGCYRSPRAKSAGQAISHSNPPLFAQCLCSRLKIGPTLTLYRRFVGGEARGAERDQLHERTRCAFIGRTDDSYIVRCEKRTRSILARVEALHAVRQRRPDPATIVRRAQLVNLIGGHPLNHPAVHLISDRLRLNPSVEARRLSTSCYSTESFVSCLELD